MAWIKKDLGRPASTEMSSTVRAAAASEGEHVNTEVQTGRRSYDTYLIIYGIIDTSRHAHEAHSRKSASPVETVIPRGTGALADPTTKLLMDSAFFITTVHIVAPMSRASAPITAKTVDSRNSSVCLRKPL